MHEIMESTPDPRLLLARRLTTSVLGPLKTAFVDKDEIIDLLGICLVGDFNRDQPTRAQLESCEELIRYLRERCGKVGMRSIIVRPHREMNPPRWATGCPGDDFPYSWFRRF